MRLGGLDRPSGSWACLPTDDSGCSPGDFQIFITAPAVASGVPTQGHNIGIRGQDTVDIIAMSDYLKAGDDPLVFSVSGLAPGTYVFACQFPGHAAEGMRGTLTIGP